MHYKIADYKMEGNEEVGNLMSEGNNSASWTLFRNIRCDRPIFGTLKAPTCWIFMEVA